MKICPTTTPFLEEEVAYALGVSKDQIRQYRDNGSFSYSSLLETGLASTIMLPNLHDIFKLAILHSILCQGKPTVCAEMVSEDMSVFFAEYIETTQEQDVLGKGSVLLFSEELLKLRRSGELSSCQMLSRQEVVVAIDYIIDVFARIRRKILDSYYGHKSSSSRISNIYFRENPERHLVDQNPLNNAP